MLGEPQKEFVCVLPTIANNKILSPKNRWGKQAKGTPLPKSHDCLPHTEPGTHLTKLFHPPQRMSHPWHSPATSYHGVPKGDGEGVSMESSTAEREAVRTKTERGHSPRAQEEYKSSCSYVGVGTSLLPSPTILTPRAELKVLCQKISLPTSTF